MDANQLRELGNQCHAAADHVEASRTRGVSVGAFDWKKLFIEIVQLLPGILALFGGGQAPTPAPGPTPPRP